MTDQEAIARLKRRGITGLEALVQRYHTQALDAAYLVLGDWELAEDVAQSAFVKAYDRIDSFDTPRHRPLARDQGKALSNTPVLMGYVASTSPYAALQQSAGPHKIPQFDPVPEEGLCLCSPRIYSQGGR